MPAKVKYNADYHDDWAWSLAIRGATTQEIADAFGISKRTVERWCNNYESFGEAIAKGKSSADSKVEKSLFQRAMGYTVTDTEKLVEVDPKTGETKPVKVKTVTKELAPDTMACMYWLNNRKRDDWNNGKNRSNGGNAVDDWVESLTSVETGEKANDTKPEKS